MPGLGEEAVWASSMLWVLENKKIASISISRGGWLPADDLPGAKAAAAKLVPKL